MSFQRQALLLGAVLTALAAGGALYLLGLEQPGRWIWLGMTAAVLLGITVTAVRDLVRRKPGVDLIALLAMAGALALGEYLAGAIIAVMLTGGGALETFAAHRARRELTALLGRAPRQAHRMVEDQIVTVDVEQVVIGDRLMVKPGEIIPADGLLLSPSAVLDESVLTGEAKPVTVHSGELLRSGGSNSGSPFEMRVSLNPAESTYAGIVRLVKAAEQSRAPFVRMADRYAVFFVGITLVVAGLAWALSGDPIRALAVLVVATPCPLILAAPAAILSGVSCAARHGIIVKGGGPLERLAQTLVVLLDKTGTVTAGRPEVVHVESLGELTTEDIVRLAASVEQASVHPFAPAILVEARNRHITPVFPKSVSEAMGSGISGLVDERRVAVGQIDYVVDHPQWTAKLRAIDSRTAVEGSSSVFVAVDGRLEGVLILHDPIRAEAPRVLRSLRSLGVRSIHMVTGDTPEVAELVADSVGIDRVFARRAPDEKVEVVKAVRGEGTVTMVGDGLNDAPALALADVGVALGARGATAASEAADMVLTADRLEGLALALRIAKRTRKIAMTSVFVGMGLSILAMFGAAAGLISPVVGAVLQEGIDVAVILNALRALSSGGAVRRRSPGEHALGQQLERAHGDLRGLITELVNVATRLDALPPQQAREALGSIRDRLEGELLPHEQEEQDKVYPILTKIFGDEDPTGPLVQTHHEIRRRARLFSRLVQRLPEEGPTGEDLRDLRGALYGLNAILTLHFAQEDELFSVLSAS